MTRRRTADPRNLKQGSYSKAFVLLAGVLPLLTGILCGQEHRNPPDAPQAAPSPSPKSTTDSPRPAPDLETTLARMAQAATINTTRRRPYTVTREYDLIRRKTNKAEAQIVADVTFRPPVLTTYKIRQSKGNLLGKEVVRRVLAGETDMVKKHHETDVTGQNYNFEFLRSQVVEGHDCYVLKILPKRKDNNLLNGTILLDANTYQIRRIEGDLQKSPSWWVKNVHVVFVLGDVGGMWQSTTREFSGDIRVIGNWTMRVRDLSYSFPSSSSDEKPEKAPPAGRLTVDPGSRGNE